MAPLSLKIILDDGAVTRTVKFDSSTKVVDAHTIIKEKVLTADDGKEYALFLTSADDELSGVWLEPQRPLDYYMLRDGDSLLYLRRTRNLRVRMLDGTLKTLQVDESKNIGDLMRVICGKIGITNHDEYGLCQEESMETEDKDKPATGTLTLKRKTQTRERDAKMEQLSKKLKTDDNVEWLDQHKTLREMGVDPKETLLLKRRLFYSDRNVDSRDPVQLNLLYVQTRDAILNGRHPVTEDQAMEFAAIQCQIHFGDFQEDKHKPGLIENLNEYLPEQYSSSWGAEKKILKLYRKHVGLSQLEAKHLYTKTARELPTYGVTFFLVKEKQKGKQKMVPRLLGINSEAILRLDEVTKEILQTWPLTHVKTYHAGKNDTFTLNFGDYSDKEYSVKTHDALRIRDILEGYIDIIRKRLCGPFSSHHDESGTIFQDNVHASRGTTITHVTNTPTKAVEQTFVGPTRILPFEQGSQASQGTQIMTVRQVILTNKGAQQQQAVSGEVPMRSDMSLELVKKLNRMNSNAVKIVTLLTDPTEGNIDEVRSVMATMEQDMPIIQNGVKESADKQKSEEARRKLLDELNELNNLLANAAQHLKSQDVDPEKVQDSARRIADLTTQMYFSLDPRTQRRSEFIRRSRQSFIQDEETDAKLRRASFIAAAAAASHAVDTALETIDGEYQGPSQLSDRELQRIEDSAVDRLGKLNAAVALFLTAHSDPKNIDYPAAVNSMNTIKELVPALAEDAKALCVTKDDDSRKELLDDIRNLCAATRRVCMLTGCDDRGKLQEAANGYADASGRLVYVFGNRNPRVSADKENEIMELAEDVGRKTTELLVQVNSLTEVAAGATETQELTAALDGAGVGCADAARDLLAIVQVSAPTIHEAHCQSAVSAAAEALSSSTQRLATCWKPLLDPPHDHEKFRQPLTTAAMQLARALDALRAAYANLEYRDVDNEQPNVEVPPEQAARLRFIGSLDAARGAMKTAHDELDKPITPTTLAEAQINGLHDNISQKMAHINAAVASLLQAKSDPDNPNHELAAEAIATITQLTPEVVKDSKALMSSCEDPRVRQVMLNDIRTWCNGISDVCASSASEDPKDLEEAARRFAQASKKLSFVFSPRARKAREQLMMELYNSANNRAMQMVEDSNNMADSMGDASGGRLRGLARELGGAARNLRNTLMVTESFIDHPPCRSRLTASGTALRSAGAQLSSGVAELRDDDTGCSVLAAALQSKRAKLHDQAKEFDEALEAATALNEQENIADHTETPAQKTKRLKFITSASTARDKLEEAGMLLDQPVKDVKLNDEQTRDLEDRLSRNLAVINAAIAAVMQSKTDRQNPNYDAADQAMTTVSDLIPGIINDTKSLSTTCDDEGSRRTMLDEIRRYCDAIRAVCDRAGGQDVKEFVESAQQFADTSKRLKFVFKPRTVSPKEEAVLSLTQVAKSCAQQMCSTVLAGTGTVPALEAATLRMRATNVANAADALDATAQLTAPSISSPDHRSVLLSAVDSLSTSVGELAADKLPQDMAEQIDDHTRELDKAFEGLRRICLEQPAGTKPSRPPVPVRKSRLSSREEAPPTPVTSSPGRVRVVSHSDGRRASQDWLDNMRRDALQDMPLSVTKTNAKDQAMAKKLEEERKIKENYTRTVDEADKKLQKAEQELNKMYRKSTVTDMDPEQEEAIRKQIGQKLALVNTAAAKLATSRHPDATDYVSGAQAVEALSELVPDLVQDAAPLLNTQDDKVKRQLLDHILALCEATRRLTAAKPNDTQASNESAVEFGDKSAIVLYAICTDVDPSQEKDVISRARAIGDSASRLASGGAHIAANGGAETLCAAGGQAARAATTLVYTAKLVATTVHHQQCQNSLIAAAHDLSSQLKTFSASWKPLSSDPKYSKQIAEMNTEVNSLEKLLEAFRRDLAAGKLVKRRHVEKIVIEDTALRQLASQIMKAAEMRAECSSLPDDKKNSFSEYAGKLRAAIRALDIANSRSKRSPSDLNKRQDLENAVQNLQVILLQSRPTLEGKPQNNIVDITDFVKDVSSEAERLLGVASKAKADRSKPEVEQIKTECHKMKLAAFKILNPDDRQAGDDTAFNDILEVDNFGQECDDRVHKIKSAIEQMEERDVQDMLGTNSLPLIESCSLLRFATKSALATSQSVALDETLHDLELLEKQIDKMLQPAEESTNVGKRTVSAAELSRSHLSVLCAARGVSTANEKASRDLTPHLAAYVALMRVAVGGQLRNAHDRNKVKDHVSKVIEQCKQVTASAATRVALWQPLPGPETCELVEQLEQELENSPVAEQSKARKLVSDNDLNSLLIPIDVKIAGNKQQVEDQLHRSADELMSACCSVVESICHPGGQLGGHGGQPGGQMAAAAAVAAARRVAASANAVAAHSNDLTKRKRTEEASQEMCWATYELLKTAELVSGDHADSDAKGSLRDALRSLGDSVNRLTRSTSPRAGRDSCPALHRSLRTQHSLTRGISPASAPPYAHCLQALHSQRDILQKLEANDPMLREDFYKTLNYATAAVINSTEYAAQCKYLISLSEQHKDVATHGLVDVPRLLKLCSATQDACFRIMRAADAQLAIEEEGKISKLTTELHQAIKDASAQARDSTVKRELTECGFNVDRAGQRLAVSLTRTGDGAMDTISTSAISLLDAVGALGPILRRPCLLPTPAQLTQDTREMVDHVDTHSQNLLTEMQALVDQVGGAPDDDGPMTWVTYDTHRTSVVEAFDALMRSLRRNGEKAGLVEAETTEEEESDAPKKSFIQIQEEEARRWLQRRPSQRGLQEKGQTAAKELILLATELSEDMKGSEKDEMVTLIKECQELLEICIKKYDNDNASALMDHLRELRKAVERGVVSRVVDDFMISDPALDEALEAEKDPSKQKFLLEKKIAELMSALSRVPRTARFVARARAAPADLDASRQKTEDLIPKLVKAAQERIASPNDAVVVERYKTLLAQYAASIEKVQEMCDKSLDPLDFVQTAGETMSRLLEENRRKEPQTSGYTSRVITRLAGRVVIASMSSEAARSDPELRAALSAAQQRLSDAARSDRGQDAGDEILRTTGEVESALGGENIFQKLPEPDQPIYNAALNLHTAVREWSARDNEIVAVAKRMAVLMARLSEQMNNVWRKESVRKKSWVDSGPAVVDKHTEDRKRELIATSKSIVTESSEVAALAKKLALECSDVRIRTNLLQVCERIPTISGQLKMLTTVKGSSLGNQGGEEDREAMNMLVTNAQNLMSSVQEVVKAAVSASVKIASQRGLKWVRRHY